MALNRSFTIVYNDTTDCWTSFMSFLPPAYINDGQHIFSVNPSNGSELWIHEYGTYNNWYGADFSSLVTLLINPYSTETKVWDNFEITSKVTQASTGFELSLDTFQVMRESNSFQNTDYFLLTQFSKRKERIWKVQGKRNLVSYPTGGTPVDINTLVSPSTPFLERMRSEYLFVDLLYDATLGSTNDTNIRFDSFKSLFRRSFR